MKKRKHGQSAKFLKSLRKKHGLGEFRKSNRAKTKPAARKKKRRTISKQGRRPIPGGDDGYPYNEISVKDPIFNPYLLRALDLGELLSIDPSRVGEEDAADNAESMRVPVPHKDGSTKRERFNREAYLWAVRVAQGREERLPQSKGKLPTGTYQVGDIDENHRAFGPITSSSIFPLS